MSSKFNIGLPSISFMAKAAVAIVLIMLVVRMTPDTWGIKKWFTATG